MTYSVPVSELELYSLPEALYFINIILFTPHAQRERGKVIGRGVHIYIYIYICLWSKKKFESYFRDRLTFSNTLTVGLLVEFID